MTKMRLPWKTFLQLEHLFEPLPGSNYTALVGCVLSHIQIRVLGLCNSHTKETVIDGWNRSVLQELPLLGSTTIYGLKKLRGS